MPECSDNFDVLAQCPCGLTWFGANHAAAPDDWRTKNDGSSVRLNVRRGGHAYCARCGAAVGITKSGEPYSTDECTWRQVDELRTRLLAQQLTMHRLRRRLAMAEAKMSADERMAAGARVMAEALTAAQVSSHLQWQGDAEEKMTR